MTITTALAAAGGTEGPGLNLVQSPEVGLENSLGNLGIGLDIEVPVDTKKFCMFCIKAVREFRRNSEYSLSGQITEIAANPSPDP